jgi:hypothetical protein
MRFVHRGFAFEVNDEWWAEAGMSRFAPASRTYHVDTNRFPNFCEVRIDDVDATRRQLNHGVFNDDAETGRSAKDRVISIFRGFLNSSALPPVEVVRLPPGASSRYKLTHGAHRFYLSIAAGFTHVPAVKGFEF